MAITLVSASINMSVALACGAVIGMERQLRQRKAGLRTNALVALGAAAFMVFSMLIEGDMSPSRVAAQVVSGIGFLGAGIIFRDGLNVQGLTTAATLWCSAAVGLLAGSGNWDYAVVASALVVFVNFALRPFVQWLKRRLSAQPRSGYRLSVETRAEDEAATRSLLLRVLALGGLHLSAIESQNLEDGVVLKVNVLADGENELVIEQAIHRIASEPGLRRVEWQPYEEK